MLRLKIGNPVQCILPYFRRMPRHCEHQIEVYIAKPASSRGTIRFQRFFGRMYTAKGFEHRVIKGLTSDRKPVESRFSEYRKITFRQRSRI